jgi:hypothetical protein
MPAGIVNRFRVVDGGYYDSSALQVAEAVKKKITEIKIDDIQTIRIKVHVISLRDRDYSITNYLQCGFGGQDMEFGAHAEAFLKARDQRSAVTVRYITEQDPDIIEFESDPYEGASLLDNPSETQNNCTGYPLAWFFSQNSQRVFKTIMESTVVANLKNYSRTLHTDLLPR